MEMNPVIAVHMTAALGALATGPVALWARRPGAARSRASATSGGSGCVAARRTR